MTTPSIPALLEPIQARLDAATPGPWGTMQSGLLGTRVTHEDGDQVKLVTPALHKPADAEFIAASPTDIARLLAAVKVVEALHKPERGVVYDPDDGETREMEYCETCSDSQWLDEATAVAWPCPTVSAVEAALRSEA